MEVEEFRKLLEIQEKSVEAWARAYNKIEELLKSNERVVDGLKDLGNLLREKPCVMDRVPYAQFEINVRQQLELRYSEHLNIMKVVTDLVPDIKEIKKSDKNVGRWLMVVSGVIILATAIVGFILAIRKG